MSMVQVAKELRVQDLADVHQQTIANAIKQLGMRSYVRFVSIKSKRNGVAICSLFKLPHFTTVRRVRALISAKARVKRVERYSELQQWLKENANTVVCLCS